jgi:hypothetical protein
MHALAVALCALLSGTHTSAAQVKLGKTTIIGQSYTSGLEFFGGIPFTFTLLSPCFTSP